ncbi:hypothetical protein [Caballeronia sp. AZ10_KS36]|uniref:hypothetical protein n=1 Tax=Caballeronia sp. AZ10_KS36 TaxID=2921757 RepID=UPI0020292284|nr:hypothetical protein [Caballeronia sp. AZ10_KS36]
MKRGKTLPISAISIRILLSLIGIRAFPFSLYTAVTDPQILEKITHLNRPSVANKADELQTVSRLLREEVNLLSPRTHRILYQARKANERLPELYAF